MKAPPRVWVQFQEVHRSGLLGDGFALDPTASDAFARAMACLTGKPSAAARLDETRSTSTLEPDWPLPGDSPDQATETLEDLAASSASDGTAGNPAPRAGGD
jgi:hypothetical protein